MKRLAIGMVAVVLSVAFVAPAPAAESYHRLGIGAHYWRNLDGIEEDNGTIYKKGLSWVPSYQYDPGTLIKFEVDLEISPTTSPVPPPPSSPPR